MGNVPPNVTLSFETLKNFSLYQVFETLNSFEVLVFVKPSRMIVLLIVKEQYLSPLVNHHVEMP